MHVCLFCLARRADDVSSSRGFAGEFGPVCARADVDSIFLEASAAVPWQQRWVIGPDLM